MDNFIKENNGRKKITIICLGLAILLAACLAIPVINICSFSTKDEKCKADVAIILGAATYKGQISPVYRERVNHGITLYKTGYVHKIIVTGGIGHGNTESDAYTAGKYALAHGIPADDILIEDTSKITQETG